MTVMELSKYQDRRVFVRVVGGLELVGMAECYPAEYGLHEFDRDEESISVGEYQIFESDILEIRIMTNVVDEYIEAQDTGIRKTLYAVRAVIADAIPDAEEKISYQMPTWYRGNNLIHFAAQKKHIGIYPGPEAVEHFAPVLEQYGLKYSKGAIQIPYDKVELNLIEAIAEYCGNGEKQ